MSVRVFVSYAHEDRAWCERLLDHLGGLRHSGQLAVFDDQQIKPGEQWDARIRGELAGASIVVPLISPSFIGSRYCSLDELMAALQGGKRLIPVLVDHVDLEALPVAAIQCLPKDEQQDLKPLVDWPNPNRALAAIAAVIRKAMAEFVVDARHARQSLAEVTIRSDVGRIDHGMAAVLQAATPRPVDAAEISPANQALGKSDEPSILRQAAAEHRAGDTGATSLLAVSNVENSHALETATTAGQLAPTVSIPAQREVDADPAPLASGDAGPTKLALSAGATHSAPLDVVSTKQAWLRKVELKKSGQFWLGMILIICTISAGGYAYWAFLPLGGSLVLRGHEGWVASAGFSPDGTRIVTASDDGTARVWRADGSGEPLVLRGHEGGVVSAGFSPDGTRIVTASWDNTARVWRADGSGEPLVLRGHEGRIVSVGFSPDGARVVTGSYDGTARVWSLVQNLPELAQLAWQRIAPVRDLSEEQKKRFFIEDAPPVARAGPP